MKKTLIALGVGLLSGCAAFALDFPVDGDGKAIQQAIDRALGWNGIFFDYPARYLRPYDEGYQDISGILFDGYEGELTGSPIQIVAEPGVKIRGVRDITFRNFKVKGRNHLRFVGNHDSVLKNIVLENVVADVAGGRKDYEAAATEPLVFRNTTINGKRIPDGEVVTPRGERQPLKRRNGGSWETLRQLPAKK